MLSFIKKLFKPSFFTACRDGNIDAVKQYLADGADVNAKDDEFGSTALHMISSEAPAIATWESASAMDDLLETAELLISRGADVNAKDNGGGLLCMRRLDILLPRKSPLC